MPWYKPYSFRTPLSSSPTYKFEQRAVCNYAFVMPAEAGTGSSLTISFNPSEDVNKNVQAYYATYLSTEDDLATTSVGDVMKKYDGKWDRLYPQDPPSEEQKKAAYDFVQQRVAPAAGSPSR